MPSLRDMRSGARCRIQGFSALVRPEVSRRLRELGFGQGEVVHCLRASPLGGPKIYSVSGAAFALESGLASQVEVGPAEPHVGA